MSADRSLAQSEWPFHADTFGLPGRLVSISPHGSGHINDSFAVTLERAGTPVRYLLQRINHRIFQDVPALMENISRVTAHLRERLAADPDAARRSLRLVPTVAGTPCARDHRGDWWRCYEFIERATSHDLIRQPEQAREAARAFGEFQFLLSDLPGARLNETIPCFHDTRQRFDRLRAVIAADPAGRVQAVAGEIAFALEREGMVDRLLTLSAQGDIPERITHNDTKISNVLVDDTTGAGLCVVDLDTVMPGLALYDFGDMVRTAANAASEDETDLSQVEVRLPLFEALTDGYLSTARGFLNPVEQHELAFAGRLITYEQGVRFLTDYLAGDVYYKIHRPTHNLDRTRNQWAFLRRLEHHADALEAIVSRHTLR